MRKTFRGANILYTLELSSKEKVLALVPSHHHHQVGEIQGIRPNVEDIVLFARPDVRIADAMPTPAS